MIQFFFLFFGSPQKKIDGEIDEDVDGRLSTR